MAYSFFEIENPARGFAASNGNAAFVLNGQLFNYASYLTGSEKTSAVVLEL